MKKIPSFTIDHTRLEPGIYVSRQDQMGDQVCTTFDLRMKRPNRQPVINTGELHAIEHIGATFLRNHPRYDDQTIYFGPMGCRTGFYLVLKGDLQARDIHPLLTEMFAFIADFKEAIPGASARDCGNYRDMNLPMARFEAKAYLDQIKNIQDSQLTYPE